MAVYTSIDNPELYFQVKTYTGNGSTQSITLDGDENMQPDFVWIKERDDTSNHNLYDSVRGVQKYIYSNETTEELSGTNSLTAFNSDGFSIGNGTFINQSSQGYVAWCWKAGTSFTNDASATSIGSIDSSGSASDTAGFSIVSYTGTGTAGTIKHGLSSAPLITCIKQTSSGGTGSGAWNFITYQIDGTSDELTLNGTGAKADRSITAPTTSVFSVDTSDERNDSSQTYICYTFAEKQGFSKFGTYTGNGNADGTFVYTGFRPAYVMIKQSSTSGEGWHIFDNKREGYNVDNDPLVANTNGAEGTSDMIDLLSNGFKLRTTSEAVNESGETYIYMAFAEAPFVNSNGVPCNAR